MEGRVEVVQETNLAIVLPSRGHRRPPWASMSCDLIEALGNYLYHRDLFAPALSRPSIPHEQSMMRIVFLEITLHR